MRHVHGFAVGEGEVWRHAGDEGVVLQPQFRDGGRRESDGHGHHSQQGVAALAVRPQRHLGAQLTQHVHNLSAKRVSVSVTCHI